MATDKLAELIERKHRILVQLRDVGIRQTELVQQGDVSALLKLLAAKQQIIAALQTVEHALAPYRYQDPESRQWRSTDDRARCAAQATHCNDMLSEILALERESEDCMIRRRDEVASRLQQAHASAQACGAYAAQQFGGPANRKSHHAAIVSTAVGRPAGTASQVSTDRLDMMTDS